ncbi:sodium:solute symporter [Candidatus Latescibacterota bacterium]
MFMHWIDWAVVAVVAVFFVGLAASTKKYTQSTADFLAANRLAGRYLLTLASEVAGLGAVSIVALFQMRYKVGWAANWWGELQTPLSLIMMLTGWVIYRFRETRSLTLAQFFEMRYGRRFRIYAGTLCWISGIINFGIFPAVGANFFIYYCGLPSHYGLLGLTLPTYHTLLLILVGLALYFTFAGGQIAVLVTDFFQSFFVNIVLMTILVLLIVKFPMSKVFDGLMISEPGKSLVNPFDAGDVKGFNPWYFLIGLIGLVINRMAWQGSQAYNVSAKSPHEAKMAGVLASFRTWGFQWGLTLIPLVAYMIMHHPDYTGWAAQVQAILDTIPDEQVRDQMVVPLTMTMYMPVGLMGAFAAVMFAAFITTHDTYLHSWGSIFIQDVYLPWRNRDIGPKQHLNLLRWSIFGVAVFIFLFSSFYRQTQDILLFFALTGAFWLGGAGMVIIGGLYTRWGTASGAFAALTSGSLLATAGMVCEHYWEDWYGVDFILTGQEVYFVAMMVSATMYVSVSLLGQRHIFNLDKMLHRGEYVVATDREATGGVEVKQRRSLKAALGITPEFTRGDKFIYGLTLTKSIAFFCMWMGMTTFAVTAGLSDYGWSLYHRYVNMWFYIVTSFIIAIWLSVGGIRDMLSLYRDLRAAKRDHADDGTVRDHDFEVTEGEAATSRAGGG